MKFSKKRKILEKKRGIMEAIRVQNVVIFPKKREFLITRNGRHVMCFLDNQGRVMVRLKGYENYYFDVRTCEVYSRGKSGIMKVLKPDTRSGRIYYHLFIAGFEKMIGLDEILRENLKEIEQYFSESKRVLKNFQAKGKEVSH